MCGVDHEKGSSESLEPKKPKRGECPEVRINGKHCFDHGTGRCCACHVAEEPPLTPEEEEEAPPDPECTCDPRPWSYTDPEPMPDQDCPAHGDPEVLAQPKEPPPPQPERRPPYLVAYSVSGHLFEVALPGDATVRAVDGALVIQHHLGPVAGIVSVLPVINKESDAQLP